MGASSHTFFTDRRRIVDERDKCEVPVNWWSVSMGEMGRWCDPKNCRLLEILLTINSFP